MYIPYAPTTLHSKFRHNLKKGNMSNTFLVSTSGSERTKKIQIKQKYPPHSPPPKKKLTKKGFSSAYTRKFNCSKYYYN